MDKRVLLIFFIVVALVHEGKQIINVLFLDFMVRSFR